MKKLFAVALLFSAALLACQDVGTRELPNNYKDKIAKLRDDTTTLSSKCADLQKQIAELQAQMAWDERQVDVTASEALHSLGYSNQEYVVDVEKLKIIPKKH